MKLHLIWDLDGTLVNSEPEVMATIAHALETVGLKMTDAVVPLRIGPPLPLMLRTAFPETVLSGQQLDLVIGAFRKIYDASSFEQTLPFDGVDDLIRSESYLHHIITNKPDYATRRIVEKKGWQPFVGEILTPNTLEAEIGRQMKKPELFDYFRRLHPEWKIVGVGDMASDAVCAHQVAIPAIGVLWGTGTREELQAVGCEEIVENVKELREVLKKYC